MRKLLLTWLAAACAFGCCADARAADEAPNFADEIRNGFYSPLNGLGFALYQDVAVSSNNPLGIPRDQVELDFRPDLNLKLRQFEFDLKTRFQWARTRTLYPRRPSLNGYRQDHFVNNPNLELPGLDYGRMALVASRRIDRLSLPPLSRPSPA